LNYGQIKTHVLRLLDEFSSNGNIQTTQDVLVKIMELSNDALMDLAATTARIPAVQCLTLNPILNELNKDTSSIKKHLPGTDFSIQLVGAKSCYFEIDGPGTVLLQEQINGVWFTIETISETGNTLKEFRRLITPTSPSNTIQLVFTGDYPYDFRNYVLYPYSWPTEADVQQFKPFFEYDFPSDFLKFDKIMSKSDTRQYTQLSSNYQLRPDRKIAINKYIAPAEILIHYWRKPKMLVSVNNEVTDEAQVLDINDDAARIIPYYVAGQIRLSEGELTTGLTLVNQYEAKKTSSLVGNDNGYAANILTVYANN
jgi:hypothetical protein